MGLFISAGRNRGSYEGIARKNALHPAKGRIVGPQDLSDPSRETPPLPPDADYFIAARIRLEYKSRVGATYVNLGEINLHRLRCVNGNATIGREIS